MNETKFPVRKNPRLSWYDYNRNGAYFITVCTHHRKLLFSQIDVGAIRESPVLKLTIYGEIVDSVIQKLPERFGVLIDRYVVMPNHVHLLLRIDDQERAIRESPLQSRSILSKAVGYLKMNVSKQMHEKGYCGEIWQRSFHDHIIRDQKEYEMIWNYIESNPMNWNQDCFFMDST